MDELLKFGAYLESNILSVKTEISSLTTALAWYMITEQVETYKKRQINRYEHTERNKQAGVRIDKKSMEI